MPYSAWRKLNWMNRNCTGKLQITEAATGSLLQEKVFLEILQNSQENTCARVSKNTLFIEHLRATASQVTLLSIYISWKKLCSHTFKASLEEVIVTYSEKMMYSAKTKAKCMTEYVWKSFFSLTCSLQKQPPERICKKGALACNFITKEPLAQVFSCEFCEISKNTFFIEHFRTTASEFAIS